MRIQFLGTGGYHPNQRRHTACVLLPESGVIFDAGTSVFRVGQRLQTDELQIFLSHAHLDHVVGLTYLLVPMLRGQVRRARVYGNRRTLDAVREKLLDDALFPVRPEFEFIELHAVHGVEISGGVITHHPLVGHPGGSTAYRLDLDPRDGKAGASLAYVTDTIVDGTYTEWLRGVDVLLHECNFPDSMSQWCAPTGHSHTTQVARLAREIGVGRLVLMHVDPEFSGDDPLDLAAARAIFPATELAEDFAELEL